jgi:uncharacterized damage-inducible protein DinB
MLKKSLSFQLSSMKEYFDRSTRSLEEADSQFAPKPEMFTAAAQVAHVAQTIDWFMGGAFNPEGFDLDFERMDKEVRAVTSLAQARSMLERAFKSAQEAIDSHSDAEWGTPLPQGPIMGGVPRTAIFGALNDHTAHHRGALTVYARLLGKVPPMPYMDM